MECKQQKRKKIILVALIAFSTVISVMVVWRFLLNTALTTTGVYPESKMGQELSRLPVPAGCSSNEDATFIEGNVSQRSTYSASYACNTNINAGTENLDGILRSLSYKQNQTFPDPIYTKYDKDISFYYESDDFRIYYAFTLDDPNLPEDKTNLSPNTRVTSLSINLQAN